MKGTHVFRHADVCSGILCSLTHGRPQVGSLCPSGPTHLPTQVVQAVCLPSNFVWAALPALVFPNSLTTALSVRTLRTQMRARKLVTTPFLALQQILGPLDHDDQCGKQKLAYKLEQVITLMSLDS